VELAVQLPLEDLQLRLAEVPVAVQVGRGVAATL
jgi:hypothetical protein